MKLIGLATLGAVVLTTAPAWARSDCLQENLIYNWRAISDDTLIVEDSTHNKFKVTVMIPDSDLRFRQNVGFQSVGGTGLSCLGSGDYVLIHGIAEPRKDPITKIVPYTPAMEKADKAAAAAKAAGH